MRLQICWNVKNFAFRIRLNLAGNMTLIERYVHMQNATMNLYFKCMCASVLSVRKRQDLCAIRFPNAPNDWLTAHSDALNNRWSLMMLIRSTLRRRYSQALLFVWILLRHRSIYQRFRPTAGDENFVTIGRMTNARKDNAFHLIDYLRRY